MLKSNTRSNMDLNEYKKQFTLSTTKRSKNLHFEFSLPLKKDVWKSLKYYIELDDLAKQCDISLAMFEFLIQKLNIKTIPFDLLPENNEQMEVDFDYFKKTTVNLEQEQEQVVFGHVNLMRFLSSNFIQTIQQEAQHYANKYQEHSHRFIYECFYPEEIQQRCRDVQFLLGPTNSGKTTFALSQINHAYQKGELNQAIYLAPLRLLAIEIYEKMNKIGVPCSLWTGEEKIHVDGAKMIACTIEMLDTSKEYDFAIIDEYQMMTSSDRGNSWNRAMINVNAKKVFILGDPDFYYGAKNLLSITNPSDNISVQQFERLSKIKWEYNDITLTNLKKGDALIVFSKRSVVGYADELARLGYSVSVLYGDLPLETRRAQSENFANGKTDVLVTTDVIGMGLNLPINRIIFAEHSKFDGEIVRPLNVYEFKQIAGRAGRGADDGKINALTSYMKNKKDYYFMQGSDETITDIDNYYIGLNLSLMDFLAEDTGEGLNAYSLYVALFEEYKKHQIIQNIEFSSKLIIELIPTVNKLKFNLADKVRLCCPPIQYGGYHYNGFSKQFEFVRNDIGETYFKLLNNYFDNYEHYLIPCGDIGLSEKRMVLLSWLNNHFNFTKQEYIVSARSEFSSMIQSYLVESFVSKNLQKKIWNLQKEIDKLTEKRNSHKKTDLDKLLKIKEKNIYHINVINSILKESFIKSLIERDQNLILQFCKNYETHKDSFEEYLDENVKKFNKSKSKNKSKKKAEKEKAELIPLYLNFKNKNYDVNNVIFTLIYLTKKEKEINLLKGDFKGNEILYFYDLIEKNLSKEDLEKSIQQVANDFDNKINQKEQQKKELEKTIKDLE